MSNTPAVHTEVHYIGGCETCQGLAVTWNSNGQVMAHQHAAETGHKGIWYERISKAVYQVTPPMSIEEMEPTR